MLRWTMVSYISEIRGPLPLDSYDGYANAFYSTLGLCGRPYSLPMAGEYLNRSQLRPQNLTDLELCPDATIDPSPEWHGTHHSYVRGLNALIDLFVMWYRSQQEQDMDHLERYLNLSLCALENLPPELRWRGGLSRSPKSNFGTDVQMVNLYITQIHIRSFLLDQMYVLAQNGHDTVKQQEISINRQNLINDMLAIVYQVPEDTLEANGNSLIAKLRDIGLTLLNEG